MTETLTLAAILVPSLVIAIVFNEVAHGYAAKMLGDTTASEQGRLTLNPIRHVDPVGTLLVPGALALAGGPIFGWAKPVPVRKSRLDNPRWGMMAVAAAGPASNFVLALIGALVLGMVMKFGGGDVLAEGNVIGLALTTFLLINTFLGLFNLLPIPPFDGSHIVGGLLPDELRYHWERLQRVGMAVFFGVIALSWVFGTSWIANIILPAVLWVMEFYIGLAQGIAGVG